MNQPPIRTFDDLRYALNERKKALGLRNLDLDDICNYQGGYSGKLFCGLKRFGDFSLPAMLDGLGVVLKLEPASPTKDAATQDVSDTCEARRKKVLSDRAKRSARVTKVRHGEDFFRKRARRAAIARWKKHAAAKRERKEKRRTGAGSDAAAES